MTDGGGPDPELARRREHVRHGAEPGRRPVQRRTPRHPGVPTPRATRRDLPRVRAGAEHAATTEHPSAVARLTQLLLPRSYDQTDNGKCFAAWASGTSLKRVHPVERIAGNRLRARRDRLVAREVLHPQLLPLTTDRRGV